MKQFMFLLLLLALSFAALDSGAVEYFLSWDVNPNSAAIVRYVIYRSVGDSLHFAPYDSVQVPLVGYTDSLVTNGIRYFYKVQAVDSSGSRSNLSNLASGRAILPSDPQSVKDQCKFIGSKKRGTGKYELSWSSAEPSKGFLQLSNDTSFYIASEWDTIPRTLHQIPVQGLAEPSVFNIRAAAYTGLKFNELTVSEQSIFMTIQRPNEPLRFRIYPVPYRPASGLVTIEGMKRGDRVKIYGSDGSLVWEREASKDKMNWNGTNSKGKAVASGVYYVLLADAGGNHLDSRSIVLIR